jgi:hypothetical protein
MDAYDVASGISKPSGEGIADIYSALRLNDSCIGRGFFLSGVCSGNGNPCISCTGMIVLFCIARFAFMRMEGIH